MEWIRAPVQGLLGTLRDSHEVTGSERMLIDFAKGIDKDDCGNVIEQGWLNLVLTDPEMIMY